MNRVITHPHPLPLSHRCLAVLCIFLAISALPVKAWRLQAPTDSLIYSPDGSILLRVEQRYAAIYRASDGVELYPLRLVHQDGVYCATFSPDGQFLATSGADSTIRIWRVSDFSVQYTITGLLSGVTSLSYSPDGQLLAAGAGGANAVAVRRTSDWSTAYTIGGGTSYMPVAFTPNGQALAVGGCGTNGTAIKLYRASDGEYIRTITESSENAVKTLSFSADGLKLVAATQNAFRVWQVDTGALLRSGNGGIPSPGSIGVPSFSVDGSLLAFGTSGDQARIIRISDGANIGPSHAGRSAVFSPDGRAIAYGGYLAPWLEVCPALQSNYTPDAMIRAKGSGNPFTGGMLYDGAAGQTATSTTSTLAAFDLKFVNNSMMPDTFMITSGIGDGDVRIRYFDAPDGGTEITEAVTGDGWSTGVLEPGADARIRLVITLRPEISLDAERHLRVTATSQNALDRFDAVDATVVKGESPASALQQLPIGASNGSRLAMSGDGRYVASGSSGSSISLFDRYVQQSESFGSGSGAVAISGDGRYVAYRSGAISVKDRSSGQIDSLQYGDASHWECSSPAISADGRYVAFRAVYHEIGGDGYRNWTVCLGDRVTGECVRVDGSDAGYPPSISANGRFISYTDCGYIYVHDRETSQKVLIAPGTTDRGSGDGPQVMSADGRFLAFTTVAGLDPADTDNSLDVYVCDRDVSGNGVFDESGDTRIWCASVASDGTHSNGISYWPAISDDGGTVAFVSTATNLAPGDTSGEDVYLAKNGETIRIARHGRNSVMSADGRCVAFTTWEPLVWEDTNNAWDVYLYDANPFQAVFRPDLMIRSQDEEGFHGEVVYNSSESQACAPESLLPGASASFSCRVVNRGDTTDAYVITGTAGDAGWDVRYYTATNQEISEGVTGVGYTLPALAPGEAAEINIRMSPKSAAVSGVQKEVTITVTSGGDPAVCDTVRAVAVRTLLRFIRVSVASDGTQANNASMTPAISADGRYVKFASVATDLVPNDTNGVSDIFLHDRNTHSTVLLDQNNAPVFTRSSTSPDGRYEAYCYLSHDFMESSTYSAAIRDLQTGQVIELGEWGHIYLNYPLEEYEEENRDYFYNAMDYFASFSATGRYLIYTMGFASVYVYDFQTGETTRLVDLNSKGVVCPSISTNERYIAFQSTSPNLVPDDTNGQSDIFVYDRGPLVPHQPDLGIRLAGELAYTGDDIYGTAEGQQKLRSVYMGSSMTYYLRVQNDGYTIDRFRLTATAENAGWTVRYFDAKAGGNNITADITGTGWLSPELQPDAYHLFRVEVTPRVTVQLGSHCVTVVTASSIGDPSKADHTSAASTALPQLSAVELTVTPPEAHVINRPVTLTAVPTNGANVEYRFFVKKQEETAWTQIRAYNTSPQCLYTTTTPGQYAFLVWAREVGSTAAQDCFNTLEYRFNQPMSAVSLAAAPAAQQAINTSITLTATALGGAHVEYRFFSVLNGVSTTVQPYGAANTCAFTPTTAGNYQFIVWAREAGSTASKEKHASVYYRVTATLTGVQLSSNKPSPQLAGTEMTLTATPTGGVNVEYRFFVSVNGGAYTQIRAYGTAPSCAYTPATGGAHAFRVWAREVGNSAEKQYEAVMPFQVLQALSAVSLDITPPAPRLANTPLTLTATPTGGKAVQYQFYVVFNGVTLRIRTYSSNPQCGFVPPAVGQYQFIVWAKETGSASAKDCYTSRIYRINPPVSAVTLAVTPTPPQAPGMPITLTATPVNGGNVEYRFFVVFNGVTTSIRGYGTANSCAYTPSGNGRYQFIVWAREVGSSMQKACYATVAYTTQ